MCDFMILDSRLEEPTEGLALAKGIAEMLPPTSEIEIGYLCNCNLEGPGYIKSSSKK